MTDTNTGKAPTAKQLNYLRALAARTGATFTPPRTTGQASAEIRRLQTIADTGFTFAELRAEEAARDAHNDVPLPTELATAIREHELSGRGSTATWSQRS